ncbi:S8 family peptidase [Actinoplanes sp. TRM 88003]|uniref:S8 family peptidase n=1 Tax=Paractinoplanes aksuensis TaxID=2939490 RepID=A0ABT1E3D2_9ACTN|nr:S8 family peptidase [Actinoplanes aksuensis]MCO8277363.1 S8 family peptidase [Actinoplanes aksuensis]
MATRRTLAAGLFAAVTVAVAVGTPAAAAAPAGDLRLADAATAIPDSYIVVLKPGAKTQAASVGGQVRQQLGIINGYEAKMSQAQAKRLAASAGVAYVEQNQTISLSATQNNATWGIDRIDQRNRPLSTTYTYPVTASNVTAYIIDTGIRYTHNEFSGGRATPGYDAVGSGAVDCNGHGTHVAGTVGGTTYGVAKQVKLVGVRVLNCSGSGTTAGVIAGVNWVGNQTARPAVANMSLGGGVSSTLDNAVNTAIGKGITFALAAGNSTANACNSSPARVANAITVGATTSTDARASYSNYGTCLDIFAPGSSITSAWYNSNSATSSISGTSMASPHVAGAAALVLSRNTGFSPAQVRDSLVNNATTGVVTNPGTGSPNRLLFVVQ